MDVFFCCFNSRFLGQHFVIEHTLKPVFFYSAIGLISQVLHAASAGRIMGRHSGTEHSYALLLCDGLYMLSQPLLESLSSPVGMYQTNLVVAATQSFFLDAFQVLGEILVTIWFGYVQYCQGYQLLRLAHHTQCSVRWL